MNIPKSVWPALLLLSVFTAIFLATPPTPEGAQGTTLTEAPTLQKEGEAQPVNILMAGDIMLGRYIATLREKKGGDFPFTHMPEIIAAVEKALGTDHLDIVAANLEGPIVETQVAWGDLVFRFDPSVAELLKKVGFTTFQTSNNHTFNQMRAGFDETLNRLTAVGIQAFGHPDTPDGPSSLISYDFNGTSVGFLGLNDTDFKLDLPAAEAKIKAAKTTVDVLIIGIHWGIEYKTTASTQQVELAHALIDAGADFIWGTHPHVVENHEVYNGKNIYYSLGNFVFDQYFSADVKKGLVLGLRIDPDGTLTSVEVPVDLVDGGEPQARL